MRKLLLFLLSIILIAPAVAKAANAQAQEYDELGLALYRQGLYAKAIPYFQNAVQADPADWQGYEDLGNSYFKINDNTDALGAYQKSLQINPDNTTLENIVQSLRSSGVAASPSAPANTTNPPANNGYAAANQPPSGTVPPSGGVENEQPIGSNQPQAGTPPSQPGTTTVVVEHRRHWAKPAPVNYADGLNPIDHAKFWTKFEMAYNYSTQTDLIGSANAINAESANGTLPLNNLGLTNGTATMSTTGYNLGAEIGFLINPNNGIGIGVRYIQSSDYNFNEVNSAAATIGSNSHDFEYGTFTPYVVPITLDYYLFMPDSEGRFFISAGVGYYAADVRVSENYNFDNYFGSTGNIGSPVGDLTAGTIGFQVSLGREFAISRNLGIEIFARGRYAKISNFQGTLSDGGSYGLLKFSDGSVDIGAPSSIGQGGTTAATIDFTGFDLGLSLNWYSL